MKHLIASLTFLTLVGAVLFLIGRPSLEHLPTLPDSEIISPDVPFEVVSMTPFAPGSAAGLDPIVVQTAADFNNDGLTDALVEVGTDWVASDFALYLANPAGGFDFAQLIGVQMSDSACTPSLGDINGDGFPDMAFAQAFVGEACLVLSTGPGSYSAPRMLHGQPCQTVPIDADYDAVLADLNNDGRTDVIAHTDMSPWRNHIFTSLQHSSGAFLPAIDLNTGVKIGNMHAVDFDADGNIDLFSNYDSANQVILSGDGTGNFGSPRNLDLSALSGVTAAVLTDVEDVDSDGFPDLIGLSRRNSTACFQPSLWINDGSGQFAFVDYTLPCRSIWDGYSVSGLADLDGDGYRDILLQSGSREYYPLIISPFYSLTDGYRVVSSSPSSPWEFGAALTAYEMRSSGTTSINIMEWVRAPTGRHLRRVKGRFNAQPVDIAALNLRVPTPTPTPRPPTATPVSTSTPQQPPPTATHAPTAGATNTPASTSTPQQLPPNATLTPAAAATSTPVGDSSTPVPPVAVTNVPAGDLKGPRVDWGAGTFKTGKKQKLTFSVTDESPPVKVSGYFKKGNSKLGRWSVTIPATAAGARFSQTVTPPARGAYQYCVEATDKRGNLAARCQKVAVK